MSTTENIVKVTFGYKDTDFTRQYKFSGVADSVCENLKDKVMSFNESISAANAGATGLATFFLSDDYDASENVGTFASITAAQYETTKVTEIF